MKLFQYFFFTLLLNIPSALLSQNNPVNLDSLQKIENRYYYPNTNKLYSSKAYTLYPNKKDRKSLVQLKRGRITGKATDYYPCGQIKYTQKYKDNLRHGKLRFYDENQQLYSSTIYKKGQRHGKYIKFDHNGLKENKFVYKNNKLNGPFKYYYTNGKYKLKADFKNGSLSKSVSAYYEDGTLKAYSSFNANKPLRLEQGYYPDGKFAYEKKVTNDITNTKGYYPNGNLKFLYSMYKDKLTGMLYTYTPKQDLASQLYFYNGNLQGIIFYSDNPQDMEQIVERTKEFINMDF
ncbi:toxin-antitoxin system YwqK family antitoxin [Myroides sp. LJL115]